MPLYYDAISHSYKHESERHANWIGPCIRSRSAERCRRQHTTAFYTLNEQRAAGHSIDQVLEDVTTQNRRRKSRAPPAEQTVEGLSLAYKGRPPQLLMKCSAFVVISETPSRRRRLKVLVFGQRRDASPPRCRFIVRGFRADCGKPTVWIVSDPHNGAFT